MPEASHIYLGGEWVAAATGETFDCHNPADGSVVNTYQQGDETDADRAVDAAADAADAWADTPAAERGAVLADASDLLDERKEELTDLLTREEGKTHAEAAPEVQRAIDIFAYYGEKARDLGGVVKAASGRDTTLSTRREPLGPVALITPWNYPIAIPAWKLAPALAAGNTAVLKPASQAPGVAEALVACLDEAGLPDGVLNFVTGPGSTVGDSLLRDHRIEAVSFTGSTQVGKHVQDVAGDTDKRIQLEMGGKNPTIVTPSADVDAAADIVVDGAFGVTGQACTATSRAIVHEDVADEVVDAIVERAEALDIGDGAAGADMGPQVSEDELAGTLEYIEIAREEGATLVTGGRRPEGKETGHFVEPTVFTDVDPEMRIAREEVFGPVLAVITVSDFEEAMAVANDVPYGLSASIVTEDLREANRFADDIEAGVAKVNEKTTGLELHVPFGGMKDSSSETYREQGDAGLDFFTISKTVYMNY